MTAAPVDNGEPCRESAAGGNDQKRWIFLSGIGRPGKVGNNGIPVSLRIYRRAMPDFATTLPELCVTMCSNRNVERKRDENRCTRHQDSKSSALFIRLRTRCGRPSFFVVGLDSSTLTDTRPSRP